ncbi:MAG: hypothetical protein CMM29_00060 [Rhodospirillaceae bacterium]|nr:hypothetical protein [Rhodospirillaceae bacterium]|tara:strand:- start:470 stop:721 length:252 start_codon:yes stop_codon:yes gene_type:complete
MVNTKSIKELVTYELKASGPRGTASLAALVEVNYTGDQDVAAVMPSVLKEMEAELKIEKYDDTDAWNWTTPRDQFLQRAVPSE